MLLSIIIPVYNVEGYIRGTLSSIYDQSFDECNFEVIVVNDGTPDNSMMIVEEFAIKHANLQIINQRNQGLSCARNAGMRVAKGEYVWFVDSDDRVSPNCLSSMFEIASKSDADILGFNVQKVFEYSSNQILERPMTKHCLKYAVPYSGKDAAKWMHNGMVQRFLFSRDFISQNTLDFFPGIYYEDTEFMVKAIVHARKIVFVDVVSYLYLVRLKGSIMSDVKLRSLKDVITIIESWKLFLKTSENDMWVRQFYHMNILSQICWNLLVGKQSDKDDVHTFFKENRSSWKRMALNSFLRSGPFLSFSRIKDLVKGLLT